LTVYSVRPGQNKLHWQLPRDLRGWPAFADGNTAHEDVSGTSRGKGEYDFNKKSITYSRYVDLLQPIFDIPEPTRSI
jgi:hypothetical protein